jgi:hypothetical protein
VPVGLPRLARYSFVLAIAALISTGFALASSPAEASPQFSDTTGTSYETAVRLLAEEGVVQGCADGEFCPNRAFTRAQMATVLTNALGLPPAEGFHFNDVAADNVHAAAIGALAESGITVGCAENQFCPNASVTRAELATFLARAFDPPATPDKWFDDTSGTHAPQIDRLAASGIAAGCTVKFTSFCPNQPVLRWQAALFLGRATDLIDRVEVLPLAERRQLQAEWEAEQRRLEEERRRQEEERRRQEEERRQQEEEAARKAEREAIWDGIAQCESGGNWSINTGNGYYGGLQFALSSWRAVGGSGYPHQHSRAEQIYRGERLQKLQGWGAWPTCARRLGLL